MPTVLTHLAGPLLLTSVSASKLWTWRLLTVCLVVSLLPDIDSVGYYLGIPYADLIGHRGLTHSMLFALILGTISAWLHKRLKVSARFAFIAVGFSVISHSILDAMTDAGLGIAFFSPFSQDRHFLPWRPIEASPLSLSRFFSSRGGEVLYSELLWVWLPTISTAVTVKGFTWIWQRSRTTPISNPLQ